MKFLKIIAWILFIFLSIEFTNGLLLPLWFIFGCYKLYQKITNSTPTNNTTSSLMLKSNKFQNTTQGKISTKMIVNGVEQIGKTTYDDFPKLGKYAMNPDGKRYDDTYITGTGYKLRELLLLIWWTRTKKPRKSTAEPPRYFFYTYNLNPDKILDKFLNDNILKINDKSEITLTNIGHQLYDEFEKLWEIHQYKGATYDLPNIDQVFHNWNYSDYKVKNNMQKIAHLNAIVNFHENYIRDNKLTKQQEEAYTMDIKRDKKAIQRLFDEIDALK